MARKTILMVLAGLLIGALAFASGQAPAGGKVVLKVWDQFLENDQAQAGSFKAVELLGQNFMKKYPNVTVQRTPMAVEEMTNSFKPALAAGKGPDVAYSELGVGFVGPILKAGYLMDLTDVWKQRGWDDKLHALAKDIPTVAGRTYGVGNELEFVPIFYNKNLFKKYNLAVPKTVAELEKVCDTLLANNIIPFAWGAKDWWYQSNFTTSMLWAFLDKKVIDDGMYKGGSWKVPGVRDAIDTAFVKWAKKGYFIPNPAAIASNEVNMMFQQQKAAMHLTGSWDIDYYVKNVSDFDVGAFPYPAPRAGMKPNTVSFCGSGYIVNAKAPKAAIDYIDYLMATEEAARVWIEMANKLPPYKKPIKDLKVNPFLTETLQVLAGEQAVPGLSMTVPPEVMTFLQGSAARVLTGQLTSDQWVEEFDALWAKGRAEGLTRDTFKF
jgi:raffinose/stachyose/melibiose transport system substrate-binding protein